MTTLQSELQRLSGTTLDAVGAANAWAGTTGKDLLGALNVKAGTTGLDLEGVANALGGTSGKSPVAALAAASAGAVPFTPASLGSNLVGWYDADTVSGSDGDPVATWSDQSSNVRHLTQATAASRPVLKLNIRNGHKVLRFDGVDDALVAAYYTPPVPYQLAVVYQSTDSAGNITNYHRDGGSFRSEVLRKSNTNELGLIQQSSGSNRLAISGAATGADWQVAAYRFAGTDASFTGQLWRGGTSLAGPTAGTLRDGLSNTRRLEVGGLPGVGDFYAGDIAEVVVWLGDSDTDRTAVRDYLAAKYLTAA